MLPDDDKYSQSKEELLAFIDVAMGGRVAEELIYGNDDITTGCSSDLSRATDIAYKYIRSYGMGDSLLLSARKKDLSDRMNFEVDQEAQKVLHVRFANETSYMRVKDVLSKNEGMLHILAKRLVERETMSAAEVRELLKIPPPNEAIKRIESKQQ